MSDESFNASSDEDEWVGGAAVMPRATRSRRRNAVKQVHEEGMLVSAAEGDELPVSTRSDLSLAMDSSMSSVQAPTILDHREERSSQRESEESSRGSGRKRTRGPPPPADAVDKRTENSLGNLTQRFVALVKHAEDGVLDLNAAAESLSVRKRRVYDITNVLEGIGLIEKNTKNVVRWKGSGFASGEDQEEMAELKRNIDSLRTREARVDERLTKAKQELRMLGEDTLKSSLAFMTYADVTQLPMYRDQAVLAIKTPPDTFLQVPDPEEGVAATQRHFQIHLKNNDGNPIYAFLLTNDAMSEASAADVAPIESPAPGAVASSSEMLARQLFNRGQTGALAVGEPDSYGLPSLSPFQGVSDAFADDEFN